MMSKKNNHITGKLSRSILITVLIAIVIVATMGIYIFGDKIEPESLKTKENLMTEIMNQIDYRIDTIIRESNRIVNDESLMRMIGEYYEGKEEEKSEISLRLNSLTASIGDMIRSVVIETEYNDVFTSITRVREEEIQINKEYLKDRTYYLSKPSIFVDSFGNRKGEISYIAPIAISDDIGGYIIINIDLSVFEDIFNAFSEDSESYIWLGYDNELIYPDTSEYSNEKMELIKEKCSFSYIGYNTKFQNDNSYILIRLSKKSDWKLVAEVSKGKLFESYQWIFLYYLISLLSIVILIISICLPMLHRQLKPLKYLSDHMKKISKGTTPERFLYENTNDEIEELSESFNFMIEELKRNNERAMQFEKEGERMRYSLLISQINPHFIYNTLNIITYLARQERHGEIIEVNHALIQILRDTLRIDEIEVYDTVWHEIDIVKQYLLIEKYRYRDFIVEFDIEENVENMNIPKNIIQPLVENALFHGIVPNMHDGFVGKIQIVIKHRDEKIIIIVTDNGMGMEEECFTAVNKWAEKTQSTRGKQIGLKNVMNRINYLYGMLEETSRLHVESSLGKGTTVTITLDEKGKNIIGMYSGF